MDDPSFSFQQQIASPRTSEDPGRRDPAALLANSLHLAPTPENQSVGPSSSGSQAIAQDGGSKVRCTGAAGGATKERRRDQACAACGKPMSGQFVRALGTVYHLDCFKCRDCGKVVASKFFPATDDMIDASGEQNGLLFALCETDYFRRLNLLCAKCGGALRGSYITALGMKFHVEHFTCSICPTVFGPQDSYYEHDGKVFCHFHYSTRFAIPCTGCRTAILKQFVEINRNNVDEHWHPECYMIHKFWNIKLCPTGMTPREGNIQMEPTANPSTPNPSNSGMAPTTSASADATPSAEALELEEKETPVTLKQKQKLMEERVYRIWTVLSAFEESSAACISEMLRDVSSGRYLGGVKMAEKFILHVEVLFSAIDALEAEFRRAHVKGISHIREARMLCKKIVNFFSLLSHTQETGARRMGITQELLSLVTGMAHYLKILIRITLSGALKLDREHSNASAIIAFLDQLATLAKEGSRESPASAEGVALIKNQELEGGAEAAATAASGGSGLIGSYGYHSLPRSTTMSTRLAESGDVATDLCIGCGQTVEEECLRLGINSRWHSSCFRCKQCQRPTTSWAPKKIVASSSLNGTAPENASTQTIEGAPPALPPSDFTVDSVRTPYDPTVPGGATRPSTTHTPYCLHCAPADARRGIETVTRLEQYAFLLRVALNRLYALLKKRGVVPPSPPITDSAQLASDEDLRDSSDIKRMRSVNLDRKLSTKAKLPHISTVVGSPSGRQPATQAMSPIENSQPGSNTSSSIPKAAFHRSPSPQRAADPSYEGREAPRPPVAPHRLSSRDVSPNPNNDPSQLGFTRGPSPQKGGASGGQALGSIIPIRPAFARHNTDVRIRDDGPIRQVSGDDIPRRRLGTGEDGITLADIPQLLEAEQAREQHRALPSDHGRPFAELSALELFIVKHIAVMVLQQSALKDLVPLDDLIEFIETRKNTFWGKLFKGGKDKKEIKKKGVFGIPLEILVERSGADSTLGASTSHLRVPSFVDDIISTMKQMDVSVEGIFRKNGNIRRLKDLTEALDRDSSQVNLSEDNPVQLAALLKKFLRELPDPLMTFKLHRLFVTSQMLEPESERMRILHMVTCLLPKAHRDTMEILFVFLKWVASFSHIDEETGSKMDLSNLATVLAPNILYSKGPNPAKDETFLANRAVLNILENQDSFWTVPRELEVVLQDRELMHQSSDMTSRDILKRCEKHALQQKASGNRLRAEYNGSKQPFMRPGPQPFGSGGMQPQQYPHTHPHQQPLQSHQPQPQSQSQQHQQLLQSHQPQPQSQQHQQPLQSHQPQPQSQQHQQQQQAPRMYGSPDLDRGPNYPPIASVRN
ncbi:RhoGAP-domain-containing protein [Tilletiaria anomala UBC 951]|uniref:RhoGAP-domain-containing protein n=1 Tax=Tilletiaria anomala (strain ATCC 24038 / CBS 436.72 / UBC 951) TaxID=1037660 RepID=A0A066W4A0_TILAU|nr:RhoGAP-domain-containing protein [Tilletiaria anomala UBC 951]KDN45879.1 RhoGAP-domain-containing protein [Tilletiaria anomala UBC 951]